MTTLTQDLIQLLSVVPKDQGYFLAHSKPLFGDYIFGGQLLAQSIVSASFTCTLPLHSLHANFISAGLANQPVLFKVENLRDSHSFSTRQVTAIQHGKPIYMVMLSYMKNETGMEYQIPEPDLIQQFPPSMLKEEQFHKAQIQSSISPEYLATFLQPFQLISKPIEYVLTDLPPSGQASVLNQNQYAEYLKLHDALDAQFDQLHIHQAIAAYYSDYNLYSAALKTHGLNYLSPELIATSLDHSMYFHHTFRVDNWVFYDMNTTRTSQSRGLTHGQMWQDGKLVASTTQENLMRYTGESSAL